MKHTLRIAAIIGSLTVASSVRAQRVVPLGEGIVGTFGVYDMLEYNGVLVIGGWFTSFDGHVRNHIQGWNGDQHFDFPGAFEGSADAVYALELFQGDLVATGREVNFNYIARWNGSVWSPMGSGLSARGRALTVFNDELIAAGQDNRVSRWNGEDWEALGDDFNNMVTALAVYEGELYAGGYFTADLDGGTELKGLARWNGTAWEQVLTGLNDDVVAMLSTTEGLVVVGAFTADGAGGSALPMWTVFDGSAFSSEEELTTSTEMTGVCAYPEGGYLVCGEGSAIRMGSAHREVIPFSRARVALAYAGKILIAGMGSAAEAYAPTPIIGTVIPGKYIEPLNANRVSATLTPNASLFLRRLGVSNTAHGFEVPQGQGTHTIYFAQPILIGYDEGVVHGSSSPFGVFPFDDTAPFAAGPASTMVDVDFKNRYFQVWKIDRSMVEAHVEHWNDPGYEMPWAIHSWPGNGDPSNGEPSRIAPFADLNGNSAYEPDQGEYPLIRGDQAVFHILHSVSTSATTTPLLPVDMTIMTYSFLSMGNQALDHTVFLHTQLFNRSGVDFSGVRFGVFADFDIGCANDDFVGCDSTRNLYFAYNWDDQDDSNCSGATPYGVQPPAQGIKFLDQAMTSHSRRNNWLGETTLTDLMQGTINGLPFNEPGYPTHFQYPGSEFVENVLVPMERQSVGAAGPYDFNSGDTLCFDLAFIYARAVAGGAYASVDALKLRADSVQAFYEGQGYSCNSDPDLINGIAERAGATVLHLYPNPATNTLWIERDRPMARSQVILRSMSGASVATEVWPPEQNKLTINLGDIASGVYAVEVTNGTHRQVLRMVRAE